MQTRMPHRLYAILDLDQAHTRGLTVREVCEAWLGAGVRLIQFRAKSAPGREFLALAEDLSARCAAAGAAFIVNDRADIARLSNASGVHLGQDDLSAADARRLCPPPAWVGVSTHDEAQVRAALREPIDYVAIGPVFATGSKARPDPEIGLDGVRRLSAIVRGNRPGLPVVAIGGITSARARDVIEAGADAVAVISALLDGDPASAARALLDAVGAEDEIRPA